MGGLAASATAGWADSVAAAESLRIGRVYFLSDSIDMALAQERDSDERARDRAKRARLAAELQSWPAMHLHDSLRARGVTPECCVASAARSLF
jgi:hypothetical protein